VKEAVVITLCVFLWAADRERDGLGRYEDAVLALLGDHGGRLVVRVRSNGDGPPDEVQVIQFDGPDAMASFIEDPRRLALAGDRARVIERTEQFNVTAITG
jgi:uncharacterized protein (DUF1330 family)